MFPIDISFLYQISSTLELFKKTNQNVWNCRCPICGDSKKDRTKTRGYFFKKDNILIYKCHNCNYSNSFQYFLKENYPEKFNEYRLEVFKYNKGMSFTKDPEEELKKVIKKQDLTFKNIVTIDTLNDEHIAKQYLLKRKIPEKYFSELYYTRNFSKFVNKYYEDKLPLQKSDERIVIPFKNRKNKTFGFQGRALDISNTLRYITINESNLPKIYGLHKIDINKQIYIVEGAFDSFFLENSLAVSGSSFNFLQRLKNVVIIYDNEPRNEVICNLIEKSIDNNQKVVLLPENIIGKDVNEIFINHNMTLKEIQELYSSNIYQGLQAKIKFNEWKKI